MGYGMMSIAKELIKKWGEGTVILSPRDLDERQLKSFSTELQSINGERMFDPQFYLPHANHEGLTHHSYWPQKYTTTEFTNEDLKKMLKIIWKNYNEALNTTHFIIPGCYSKKIDKSWKDFNDNIIETLDSFSINKPKLATISLSASVLQSEEQIHEILDHVETWPVDGFYILAEHPNDLYYVDDPVWLVNLLDLCAGLKLQSKFVLVGYCNHQLLPLALANVDAIASGTFVNVRNFSVEKFREPDENETSRRSNWYYSPQTLSEFQVVFLDMAQRAGILDVLKTNPSFGSKYADALFSGAKPTDTGYGEVQAFRHYLQCLRVQTDFARRQTYKETYDGLSLQLMTATKLIDNLHKKGVRGKHRDFGETIDINTSAITLFNSIRGFVMSRNWSK